MRRRSFLKLLLSPLLAAVPVISVNTRIDKRSVMPGLLEPIDPPFVFPSREHWVVQQVWVNGVPMRQTRLLSFPVSREMLPDADFHKIEFN